jgi:hypothetical protein
MTNPSPTARPHDNIPGELTEFEDTLPGAALYILMPHNSRGRTGEEGDGIFHLFFFLI